MKTPVFFGLGAIFSLLGPTMLVDIQHYDPSIEIDVRYASDKNFVGRAVYTFPNRPRIWVHATVAELLVAVQAVLKKENLGLKIFDGYRPLHVQQLFWDIIQDERYVTNPAVNKGRHTRGTAIDVTLIDLTTREELVMGTEFDDLSELAFSNATNISPEAARNRKLLRVTMEAHGFTIFPYEWWHFDLNGWLDDINYPALDVSFAELESNSPSPLLVQDGKNIF